LNSGLEGSESAVTSAEGARLFVDLGGGAGAIPVRADLSNASVFRSTYVAVLAFMLILAGGGIFAMRKLGLGVSSGAQVIEISIDSTAAPKVDAHRFTQLMAELEAGDRPVQIDDSKLGRSPFELSVELADVEVDGPGETEAQRMAREAEQARLRAQAERAKLIQSTLQTLKLYSVVGGRTPAARINEQIVREGDLVADLFLVKKILARTVILEADDQEYEIGMAGNGAKP